MIATTVAMQEQNVNTPEIYRSTPFEFAVTVETADMILVCSQMLPIIPALVPPGVRAATIPAVPSWMETFE